MHTIVRIDGLIFLDYFASYSRTIPVWAERLPEVQGKPARPERSAARNSRNNCLYLHTQLPAPEKIPQFSIRAH
jgi:hypothetical protein